MALDLRFNTEIYGRSIRPLTDPEPHLTKAAGAETRSRGGVPEQPAGRAPPVAGRRGLGRGPEHGFTGNARLARSEAVRFRHQEHARLVAPARDFGGGDKPELVAALRSSRCHQRGVSRRGDGLRRCCPRCCRAFRSRKSHFPVSGSTSKDQAWQSKPDRGQGASRTWILM